MSAMPAQLSTTLTEAGPPRVFGRCPTPVEPQSLLKNDSAQKVWVSEAVDRLVLQGAKAVGSLEGFALGYSDKREENWFADYDIFSNRLLLEPTLACYAISELLAAHGRGEKTELSTDPSARNLFYMDTVVDEKLHTLVVPVHWNTKEWLVRAFWRSERGQEFPPYRYWHIRVFHLKVP